VPLEDVSRIFWNIQLVENLLNTPQLIMISLDDEEREDQLDFDRKNKEDPKEEKEELEEDPTEDLDMGEPHPG